VGDPQAKGIILRSSLESMRELYGADTLAAIVCRLPPDLRGALRAEVVSAGAEAVPHTRHPRSHRGNRHNRSMRMDADAIFGYVLRPKVE
jgi:hypothetical protein